MDIKEIIRKLTYFEGTFPRIALQEAIRRQREVTPALLDILRYSIENIEEVVEQDDYMAHMYALYLLAQFREKQAYPLIADFFSVPGEIVLDTTGDIVTEDLHRILASVCHGDISLITQLAENESVNEFVRSAALQSLLCLVVSGEKSREEVIEYYRSLFHSNLSKSEEQSYFWAVLVSHCADLCPEEVYEEIKQAYEAGIVDKRFIGLDSVNRHMALGKDEALHRLRQNNSLITDTISEMEHWYAFQQAEKPEPVKKKKIGRNEPCPCGSGKKYKKCCGA